MKTRLLIALVLLASAAWAGPIYYIDTFDTTVQGVCYLPVYSCIVLNSTVSAPEAVGGVRAMHLNPITGSVAGSVNPPSQPFLSFSQDVASSGILDVVWAGTSGLNLDLTQEDGQWFMMRVHSDNGMSGVLTLVTLVGSVPTSSSATFTIPASAPGVWELVYVPLGAFSGANLTQTQSIDLTLDGTSHVEADSAVDYLGVDTPEPGSLLLIGGGLLGLSLLRRRMRRA